MKKSFERDGSRDISKRVQEAAWCKEEEDEGSQERNRMIIFSNNMLMLQISKKKPDMYFDSYYIRKGNLLQRGCCPYCWIDWNGRTPDRMFTTNRK